MSRRNLIRKFQVINAADSTAGPLSTATDVSGVDVITYQISIAALVNCTLVVYFSNDAVFSAATAKTLNFAQATPLAGATDTNYLIHFENKGFKWLQIGATYISGSGNISAWVSGSVGGA